MKQDQESREKIHTVTRDGSTSMANMTREKIETSLASKTHRLTFSHQVPPRSIQWIVRSPRRDVASVRFSSVVFILIGRAKLCLRVQSREGADIGFPAVMLGQSSVQKFEIVNHVRVSVQDVKGLGAKSQD